MNNQKTAVVAVGGNALILDPQHSSIDDQYEAARQTSAHVVDLLLAGWRVVLTHGNGPQVGFILRRSELAMGELPQVPMHYAGADIQGAVGYMFVTALQNELANRGASRPVTALVTRVLVDPKDPAFANPSKPIGAHMTAERAEKLSHELGWQVIEDSGRGWRRVVPSPQPKEILDLEAMKVLIGAGYTIVGAGGGGIPVQRDATGQTKGVEAVIDKDLASSLLAQQLGVDAFIVVTAVPQVAINFNTPQQESLDNLTLAQAQKYLDEGQFGKGSMAPKVQAVMDFVRATGGTGIITDPEHLLSAVQGTGGTRIIPGGGR